MQKRKSTGALATLTLVLLVPPGLGAQDLSEDDIFAEGAFESQVAQGQTSEEANKLVWLSGVSLASNTGLVLPLSGDYGSSSQFVGKGFLKATKPTTASLFVSYAYAQTLWAAASDPDLRASYNKANYNPAQPQYTLSEFHLSFDLGKVVFVRVGNQLLDWGASAVWSPADFINRVSDPTAAIDTRSGKPGVRLHVPFPGGNVFVFADASQALSKGQAQDLSRTGTLGVKVDTVVGGWNLGLVGNGGATADPRLGLTLSGAAFGVDLWAEAGSVVPVADHDFCWSASLGGERSFGLDSEWTVRAEGFWNPEGQDDTALDAQTLPTFVAYYWGRAYGYAEVVKKKLLGPDVTGSVSATANLSDRTWTGTASLRTAFANTLPFSLYVQYNGGAEAREFTLATGGPAVTLGLRSIVEF